MTEYWKSNPMHWCDCCKCWMQDTKQARLNHERGMGHKENLAKKLREMAKKADQDKRDEKAATSNMERIEEAAQKQFQKDQKAAQEAQAAAKEALGIWVWDAESNYYYNAAQRWYYDPKTKWYYGGTPITWVQVPPSLPKAAMFGTAAHEGGPVPQSTSTTATTAPSTASTNADKSSSGTHSTAPKKYIEVPKHPLANVGGYQAPSTGRVGGAKGVGAIDHLGVKPAGGEKRKREDDPKGKAMSKEEAEAHAKREAARARVQQRTASQFGYS